MAGKPIFIDRRPPTDTGEWITRLWLFGPLSAHSALTLTPIDRYKYVFAVHLIRGLSNAVLPENAEFRLTLSIHDIVRLNISDMKAGYRADTIGDLIVFQTDSSGSNGAETALDANFSVVSSFSWLPRIYISLSQPIPVPPYERLIVDLPSDPYPSLYPDNVRFYVQIYGVVESKP